MQRVVVPTTIFVRPASCLSPTPKNRPSRSSKRPEATLHHENKFKRPSPQTNFRVVHPNTKNLLVILVVTASRGQQLFADGGQLLGDAGVTLLLRHLLQASVGGAVGGRDLVALALVRDAGMLLGRSFAGQNFKLNTINTTTSPNITPLFTT